MHVREYVEQVIFHEVGQETFEKKKYEQSLEEELARQIYWVRAVQ